MGGHAARAHAPFAPSSTERWSACPASVRLTEAMTDVPESDSYYTVRGTLCHEKSEEYLLNGEDPNSGHGALEGVVKSTGEKVVVYEDDWKAVVVPYVEGIRAIVEGELLEHAPEDVQLLVERRVKLNTDGADTLIWGTADVMVLTPTTLHVVDLKAGSGHLVPASAPQFRTYAACAVSEFGARPYIFTHVFQAANEDTGGHDVEQYTTMDLIDFTNDLLEAIDRSKYEDAVMGDHCHYCPALTHCPAHTRAVGEALDHAVMEPKDLPVDRIAWVLEHAKDIEKFIKACQAYAIEQGGIEGHFKVVEGRSHRAWAVSDAEAELALLEAGMSTADIYDTSLKAFSKIEKILGKEKFARLNLVEKQAGKPSLAPVSDPRPALGEAIGDVLDNTPAT